MATVRQYGESWDEQQFFKYADRALQAYSSWWQTGAVPITGNTYDNYGPAYVMLVAIFSRILGWLLPWITSDIRHLVYVGHIYRRPLGIRPTLLSAGWAAARPSARRCSLRVNP